MIKKLYVYSFNQHWFHLGSAVENILHRHMQFEACVLLLFQQHLRVLPLDMHFRFPLSRLCIFSPERIAAQFVQDSIGKKFVSRHIGLEKTFSEQFPLVRSVAELKSLKIDDMQIGMAIASHLISFSKHSQPDPRKYRNFIQSCYQYFLDFRKWFEIQDFQSDNDEFWVCNGRTFHERIIVELAKKYKITTKFYEIGGEGQVPNRWILHNDSPHDRKLHQMEITRHFEQVTPDVYEIDKWFTSREDPDLNKFASSQPNTNVSNKNLEKPFVAFFSSSDDEVAAISAEWNSPWGEQIYAARELIEIFSKQDKFKLIIRVHPNQGKKSKHDRKNWDNLKEKAMVYIYRYSDLANSYQLMRDSQAVLTHGSTMGVEAAYRRKRQAFLAPSRYDELIGAPLLDSKYQVELWLETLTRETHGYEEDISFEGAQKWAHYMLTAGFPWENVKVSNKRKRYLGELGGKRLKPHPLILVISKVYTILHRLSIERKLESIKLYLGRCKWQEF